MPSFLQVETLKHQEGKYVCGVLHLESGRIWAGGLQGLLGIPVAPSLALLSSCTAEPAAAPPSWSGGPSVLIQGDVTSNQTGHLTPGPAYPQIWIPVRPHPPIPATQIPPLPYYFGFSALSPHPLMPCLSSLALQPLLQHEFPN